MATSYQSRLGSSPEEGMKAPVAASSVSTLTLYGEQTVNSVSVASGDRVLVKDQDDSAENGIYVISVGTWKRASDFNAADDVKAGILVPDSAGGVSANSAVWMLELSGEWSPGVTEITFVKAINYSGYGDSDVLALGISPFTTKSSVKSFGGYSVVTRISYDGSWWDYYATSTDDEDGGDYAGTIIETDSGTGRWIRDYEALSPYFYGATGDRVTSDSASFELMIAHARANQINIRVPAGKYRLTEELQIQAEIGGGLGAYNAYDFLGAGENSTEFYLDYDGDYGITYNRERNNNTALSQGRFGGYRIYVAVGKTVAKPHLIMNTYDCNFKNIHIHHDNDTVNSGFVGFRVSGGVYRNVYDSIRVVPYNNSGTPNAGKGFYIGNGYVEAESDYAATNIATWINCHAQSYSVGFDVVIAEDQNFIGCDSSVSATNWRILGGSRNEMIGCWDEGSTVDGVVIDSVTLDTYPSGTRLYQAAANIIEGGFFSSINVDNSFGTRVRTRANSYNFGSGNEDLDADYLNSNGVTTTGLSNDAVVKYRQSSPFDYNAISLGSKRLAYEFPNTTDTSRFMLLPNGDNPCMRAYRGNGTNYAGWGIDSNGVGTFTLQSWTGADIGSESPTTVFEGNVSGTFFSLLPAPKTDGGVSLGDASLRFSTVYAVNGTINTSDEREKNSIRNLDDKEKAVSLELKKLIKVFKWNHDSEGLNHVGVIAQEVIAAFESHDLDAFDYGIVTLDKWDDDEIKGVKAGDRYGVNYNELICFIISSL